MPANGITSTKLNGKKKIPRSSQGTIVSHELILHLGQLKRFRFFPPKRYGLNLYKYENLFREVIVKDTCHVNKFTFLGKYRSHIALAIVIQVFINFRALGFRRRFIFVVFPSKQA